MQKKPFFRVFLLAVAAMLAACTGTRTPEGIYSLDRVNGDKISPEEIESSIEFRKDGTCKIIQDGNQVEGKWKMDDETGNMHITSTAGHSMEMKEFSLQDDQFSYLSQDDTLTFIKISPRQ